MRNLENLNFTNSFSGLPNAFYSRLPPTPLAHHHLVSVNPDAAALIDLDPAELVRPDFVDYFGGRRTLPGSDPLAALYAGHQFGAWVPQLGDGRAILLGEVTNQRGERWELQLKGAGETPYSRAGDGRAVLRSTLREYLCSEAMHGLGIATTRALCVIGSREEVYRERIEPGAMLVRMAPSHLRFGNFEVFFHRREYPRLRQLADYLIAHHFPDLQGSDQPYLALLSEVIERTARLMAQWQGVGFAHGVMNTDNMSLLGLTLDYGPFGFLDAYDPGFICNHSDRWGRYAFDRQPAIALWNLSCLAQAMLPLFHDSDPETAAALAREALQTFEPAYRAAYLNGMRAKLGLTGEDPADEGLVNDLLTRMQRSQVDYTNLFRALCRINGGEARGDDAARDLFLDRSLFDRWAERYRQRLQAERRGDDARQAAMRRANPKYILRNYLAQQAIEQAERGAYEETERLLALLRSPYDEQPGMQAYAAEPPDWGRHIEVSCSS
ncbi:MAG: YdiU family protein [Candidatus Thiodiazotropha sp.]